MGKPVNEPTANEGYMVEVVGHDGIVHHLGPFQTRDDAQSWIAQNTLRPGRDKSAQSDEALPKLSIV